MATNMPRENVYLRLDQKINLETHAKKLDVSKSMLVRSMIDDWLVLHTNTRTGLALCRFAEDKGVDTLTVIVACLQKQIPKEYWEDE